ncbi:GAF domain-containing protein [Rivularia sp. PCC 7116]|uniref:GAF domain-containing sensor histidine kinase n=1 Tax=Rivularia sp. PCC 7116 TaxID=373994 RepID=UPI0002D8904B|nr:GAF domain-containing protein [Rivularia sp. PCC 7116]
MNQIELLNRITRKIRQSLELREILDAAVTEVRAFLKIDRVKIYKFYRQERKQRLLVEMQNHELENARKEAERASSLKSTFLSSSSHELRTPLASILNYLKLLKEGFYENEQELLEYIETAHLSAENLHRIVDSILDIAILAGRTNKWC